MKIDFSALILPLDNNLIGENPVSLPAYDLVQAEIEKLEGIEKLDVNWTRVGEHCTALLSNECKDIRLANYLVYAWYNEHKFEGLAVGFEFLRELISTTYAKDIYPARRKKPEKGRAAPFSWLSNRLEKDFEQEEFELTTELASAAKAISNFTELDTRLKEYLGEEAPIFAELKSFFRRFQVTIDEQIAQQKVEAERNQSSQTQIDNTLAEGSQGEGNQVSETSITKSSADTGAAINTPSESNTTQTPSNTVSSPPVKTTISTSGISKATGHADINKALNSAGQALKSVADVLKSGDQFSSNGFYLSRTAKWMLIQDLPASDLLDRQPNDQAFANLKALESNGKHEELIMLAEQAFNNGAIFCLSLHRYIYNGLIALGKEQCATVVLDTTSNFVARFPGILDVNFKNGEPFADELTKTWLQVNSSTQVSEPLQTLSSLPTNSFESQDSPWEDARLQANKLIASGKIDEALHLFQTGISGACNIRETAFWQYEMSLVLSQVGQDQMVVMQLEHLSNQLNTQPISKWDANFAAQVLKLLLASHKKLQQKVKYEPQQLEKINEAKQALLLLMPAEATVFFNS